MMISALMQCYERRSKFSIRHDAKIRTNSDIEKAFELLNTRECS